MKAKIVRKKPLPENLTLQQIHNFAMANKMSIEFDYSQGKPRAFIKLYEVEYDSEEMRNE